VELKEVNSVKLTLPEMDILVELVRRDAMNWERKRFKTAHGKVAQRRKVVRRNLLLRKLEKVNHEASVIVVGDLHERRGQS
jgi:hypothetical protein